MSTALVFCVPAIRCLVVMTLTSRGMPGKVRAIGKIIVIGTPFRLQKSLRSTVTKSKPKNEILETRNCIHSIPCVCGKKCVRDTENHLSRESSNTDTKKNGK